MSKRSKRKQEKLPAVVKAAEGEWRPGPYMLDAGWLSAGAPMNFWQMGDNVRPYGSHSAVVEGCISSYAQTVAMCPGSHWLQRSDGGRDRVTTSALNRIIVRPNDYQSISDFLMNLVSDLYEVGNTYALAIRNQRSEVDELHLMRARSSRPLIGDDGSIFYQLGGNPIVDHRFGENIVVAARDVMHIRLKTPRHPLVGVTPLLAAHLEIAMSDAMLQQQLTFFLNEAKPSIGLSTDQILDQEQTNFLRRSWQEQTRGAGAGGTPILTAGLKVVEFDRSSQDSQLAEMLKISTQAIATAFRVPQAVLGLVPGATSTEALMSQWKATGLGFILNHIEEAFGNFFRLRGYPVEYLELDTDALLRSAFKDRVEGFARGIQAGLFAPDEGRAAFDYGKVPFGSEPRVQQQMVPLSYGAKVQPPDPNPAPALPAPDNTTAPADETDDSEATDASKHATEDVLGRIFGHAKLHAASV